MMTKRSELFGRIFANQQQMNDELIGLRVDNEINEREIEKLNRWFSENAPELVTPGSSIIDVAIELLNFYTYGPPEVPLKKDILQQMLDMADDDREVGR